MDLGKSGLEVCISLGMVTETMIVEFTWDRWGAEHSGKNTVGVKSLLHQRGASALISFRPHRQKCRASGAEGFSMEKSQGVGWCKDCHR